MNLFFPIAIASPPKFFFSRFPPPPPQIINGRPLSISKGEEHWKLGFQTMTGGLISTSSCIFCVYCLLKRIVKKLVINNQYSEKDILLENKSSLNKFKFILLVFLALCACIITYILSTEQIFKLNTDIPIALPNCSGLCIKLPLLGA